MYIIPKHRASILFLQYRPATLTIVVSGTTRGPHELACPETTGSRLAKDAARPRIEVQVEVVREQAVPMALTLEEEW
jgi:hypothetical protein